MVEGEGEGGGLCGGGRIHRRGKERVRVEHDDDGDDAGTTKTDGAVSYVISSCYVHRNGVGMGGFCAFSSGQVYTVNITACLLPPLAWPSWISGAEVVWLSGCLNTHVMLFTAVCGPPIRLCNRRLGFGSVHGVVSDAGMWSSPWVLALGWRTPASLCTAFCDTAGETLSSAETEESVPGHTSGSSEGRGLPWPYCFSMSSFFAS